MLKTLGTVASVIGVFILGIATLVAGYWLGILASLIMGALTIILGVATVVGIIVYTIIEAVTLKDEPSDDETEDESHR